MTNEMFWDLLDSGKIRVAIWYGENDGKTKEVDAFEHDGKFFLRICATRTYVTGERAYGKRYRMAPMWNAIKEFDTRESANAYFKKCADGLKRVR